MSDPLDVSRATTGYWMRCKRTGDRFYIWPDVGQVVVVTLAGDIRMFEASTAMRVLCPDTHPVGLLNAFWSVYLRRRAAARRA